MAFLGGDDARQLTLPLGNGDGVERRNDGIGRGEVLDDLITEDAVGTHESDANAGQADRLNDGAGGAAVLGDELGDGVHRGLRQFRRGRGGVRLLGIGAHDSTILVGSPEATSGMD